MTWEREDEEETIKARLRELHQQLEGGQISEADFDVEEAALLDRLDALTDGRDEDDDDEGDGDDEGEDDEGEDDDERDDEGGGNARS